MKSLTSWIKDHLAPDRGTFIFRPVLNAELVHNWAKNQNIGGNYIPPNDMHVTVMYSTVDIREHINFKLATYNLMIESDKYASVLQRLGSDGAIVLKFQDTTLFDRWRQLIGLGAIWTYPTYIPHVTLSYKTPESCWWTTVIPAPTFPLLLGPEQVEDFKINLNTSG